MHSNLGWGINISEKNVAPMFGVEEYTKQGTDKKQAVSRSTSAFSKLHDATMQNPS
jgi:hypothetical protein